MQSSSSSRIFNPTLAGASPATDATNEERDLPIPRSAFFIHHSAFLFHGDHDVTAASPREGVCAGATAIREANVSFGHLTRRAWEANPVGHPNFDGRSSQQARCHGFDSRLRNPV